MKRSLLLRIFFFLTVYSFIQSSLTGQIVVTTPQLPNENAAVKITFDATQGTAGLKDFTGDVYAHTGVLTDKSASPGDWKYVKTTWGTNTPETKLTRISANIYELNITPNIRSYYGVPVNEKILKLAFVFRSSDSKKEGKATGNQDIFVEVYEDKFLVDITNPTEATIKEINQQLIVSAISTEKTSLSVLLNGSIIKTLNDTSKINDTITFDTPGDYWIKVTGTFETVTSVDSVFVSVYGAQETATIPAGMRNGINYVNNQTVTLVLYAPYKQFVHVIGDFNNWLPQSTYKMKKDGDRFWITINNLIPQKEYIFQYLVDGTIRIADPYSEKISDPYDDKFIPASTYPNLIAYPAGKTFERATVIQTGQTSYSWQHTNYTIPEKKDLVIYELLIRDFTTEGTIDAAKEKLPYLKNLGVNVIELMPFNEFEGNNSWGYNPNFYFATDKAYGTKTDYKEFIDACHGLGMMVIQDIVLNHSYGSSPLARMYWDNTNNRPAANNPWYNVTSPNQVFSWGSDFNHESAATKQLVDSVNKFWLTEYKVDGFRYDFAKGFTNTPGDGSAYDPPRMAILERMADVVWNTNPNAFVILEFFAPNEEEKVLASYKKGMLNWGNANFSFGEASMGFHDNNKSDFSWASASTRGYSQPGLVTYIESHDEERIMFRNITYGNVSGSYSIKNKNTALRRAGMAAAFFLSIPGPKMIWQFGEMGYDVSIDENGRLGNKPVRWEYLQDTARFNNVYKIYRSMIALRKLYPVFSSGAITMSVNGPLKKINLTDNDLKVTLIGNFDVAAGAITPNFQHTGTWYEFFSGKTHEVTSTTASITLQPGEYRLYTDKLMPPFTELALNVKDEEEYRIQALVYPNPASNTLFVGFEDANGILEIYNSGGQKLVSKPITETITQLSLEDLKPGLYFMRVTSDGKTVIKKFVKE